MKIFYSKMKSLRKAKLVQKYYDQLAKITSHHTGRFIMFSGITNIYNKKTKGPTLMEFSTATAKLKKFFF